MNEDATRVNAGISSRPELSSSALFRNKRNIRTAIASQFSGIMDDAQGNKLRVAMRKIKRREGTPFE